jgi:acyl-CoA dehydrogenase
MYSNYYKDHELFIESVRRFLASKVDPFVDQWEQAGYYPDEIYRALGEHGFLGLLIDEEYGGTAGDYSLAGAWCEAFGEVRSHGFVVGVNMHSLVVSYALNKYGSSQAKAKWLPAAVTGEAIGAYAFTEPGAGSDLASLRTKAEFVNGRWILNGTKIFITNGARANFVLVLARTDPSAGYKGFTTFVVDTKAKGFKVNRTLDKLGWRSSDTAELFFDNVELEEHQVLGIVGDGWIQASEGLNWERMMLTLTALGGARAAFRSALRYSRERSAFGRKIGEFDFQAEQLKQMYARLVFGEALSHRALSLLIEGRSARVEVSLAKRLVCDDALFIADQGIQIHGGYGYTSEFPAERWWRDLRLMPIGGGTSEIMASVAQKEQKF